MTLQIRSIAAFDDNYIWCLERASCNAVCVVDPGAADPVLNFLRMTQYNLASILLTHHHTDHVGGVSDLLTHYPEAVVYGPISPRINNIAVTLRDGDGFELLGRQVEVLTVPGHTLDHIAYHVPAATDSTDEGLLFCGDTLFAAGCGRLFEGTAEMMYNSLSKLARLPRATQVYCAHEYTVANLRFAVAAEPDNLEIVERLVEAEAKRRAGESTLPSTIDQELRTNPFLRCRSEVPGRISNEFTADTKFKDAVEIFAALRRWKDNFRA